MVACVILTACRDSGDHFEKKIAELGDVQDYQCDLLSGEAIEQQANHVAFVLNEMFRTMEMRYTSEADLQTQGENNDWFLGYTSMTLFLERTLSKVDICLREETISLEHEVLTLLQSYQESLQLAQAYLQNVGGERGVMTQSDVEIAVEYFRIATG